MFDNILVDHKKIKNLQFWSCDPSLTHFFLKIVILRVFSGQKVLYLGTELQFAVSNVLILFLLLFDAIINFDPLALRDFLQNSKILFFCEVMNVSVRCVRTRCTSLY